MDTISLCNLCLVSWYLVVFWVKTLRLYHLSACALRDAQRTPLAPGSHVRAGARRARAIWLPLRERPQATGRSRLDGRSGAQTSFRPSRQIRFGFWALRLYGIGHLIRAPEHDGPTLEGQNCSKAGMFSLDLNLLHTRET